MLPRSGASQPAPRWPARSPFAIAVATMTAVLWSHVVRADGPGRTLCVEPATIRLEGRDSRQQLVVSLRSEDRSVRDVTVRCRYVLDPSAIATIDAGGVVRPRADGQALLRVVFEGRTAECPSFGRIVRAMQPIGFRTDVVPLFSKAGCNMGACHGNSSGKGGFRLSLRGDDPSFDLLSLTRDQLGRRIDLIAARKPDRPQADRSDRPRRGHPISP